MNHGYGAPFRYSDGTRCPIGHWMCKEVDTSNRIDICGHVFTVEHRQLEIGCIGRGEGL